MGWGETGLDLRKMGRWLSKLFMDWSGAGWEWSKTGWLWRQTGWEWRETFCEWRETGSELSKNGVNLKLKVGFFFHFKKDIKKGLTLSRQPLHTKRIF